MSKSIYDFNGILTADIEAEASVGEAIFFGPFPVGVRVQYVEYSVLATGGGATGLLRVDLFSNSATNATYIANAQKSFVKAAELGTPSTGTLQITMGKIVTSGGPSPAIGKVALYHEFSSDLPYLGIRLFSSVDDAVGQFSVHG